MAKRARLRKPHGSAVVMIALWGCIIEAMRHNVAEEMVKAARLPVEVLK